MSKAVKKLSVYFLIASLMLPAAAMTYAEEPYLQDIVESENPEADDEFAVMEDMDATFEDSDFRIEELSDAAPEELSETITEAASGDFEISKKGVVTSHPALNYTYEVTPILSPFCYAVYVKTENPDVSEIRFADKSIEAGEGEDPASYIPCECLFPDVEYENTETFRVSDGYIFEADDWAAYPDGGKLTLQVKKDGYEYLDTNLTVNCPKVQKYTDYLIEYYTDPSRDLFTNLDAVQSALNELAVYPKSVLDSTKPSSYRPYPLLAASPYAELGLNEHYEIYESLQSGMLLSRLYPFILDSASFPGTMQFMAKELEPDCEVESAAVHWGINVTYKGTTKYYGGAGTGTTNEILLSDIETLYTFRGDEGDFAAGASLAVMREKLIELGEKGDTFVNTLRDQLSGETFRETIGTGSWIRVAREGWFGYGEVMAYAAPSAWGDVTILSDAWVDGRYINEYESWDIGAKFSDHPDSTIVIRNMSYTDAGGQDRSNDVIFYYDEENDRWSAQSYYYADYWTSEKVPEQFYLTREQVKALNLDGNTNSIPETGLIYDGTVEPGTPFTNVAVTGIRMEKETAEVEKGSNICLNVIVEPSDATYHDVMWFSSDESIATVDDYGGTVHGVAPGTVEITATTMEGRKSAVCVVTVVDHKYKNVVTKATTTANGKIVRKCSICGNIEKTTTIYKASDITASKKSFVYSGKVQKPTVTVKDSRGKIIAEKYYSVTYSNENSKTVGTYTVTVKLKDRYSGSKKFTYKIVPKKTSLISVTSGIKQFTVKWTKQAAQTNGYEIEYSLTKGFTSGNTTVPVPSNKTVSAKVKNLKSGKTYYVRIRTFKKVGDKTYYSAWSKSKLIKVN